MDEPSRGSASFSLLDLFRLLRSSGADLFTQMSLHAELAQAEWAEEKNRLLRMLLFAVLGLAFLINILLLAGMLVLVLSWNTGYEVPALLAVLLLYGLGLGYAWRRFDALSARGANTFAATREEIAADIALLKSRL